MGESIEVDLGKTTIFEDIRNSVNEELGIRAEVAMACAKLVGRIEEEARKLKKAYFADIPGVSSRIGDFPFTAFGKTITVRFRYCNFRDPDYYERYREQIPLFQNGFKLSTLTLTVDVHSVSGQVVHTTLSDTVQDELEDYFRQDKSGREMDDNVNDLYALLVRNYRNENKPTYMVLEDSPIYLELLQMRNNAKNVERELINRIGKCIVKAQKDCDVPNDLGPTWWK